MTISKFYTQLYSRFKKHSTRWINPDQLIGIPILTIGIALLLIPIDWYITDHSPTQLILTKSIGAGLLIINWLRTNWLLNEQESLRKKSLILTKNITQTNPIDLNCHFKTNDLWQSALNQLQSQHNEQYFKLQSQLTSIFESIADCIIVINSEGMISMHNQAAVNMLGEQRLIIGSSIFSAFKRRKLAATLASLSAQQRKKAQLLTRQGDTLNVRLSPLNENQGYVLCFNASTTEMKDTTDLNYDFSLFIKQPSITEISLDTPLDDLPALIIDSEATGLNVHDDAVISIGGVHCQGTEIFSQFVFEQMIKPDRPLTQESIQIHGIQKHQLENQPQLGDAWELIIPHLNHPLIVGHQIGFDIAILKHNLKRYQLDWQPQHLIDTMLLAYSLLPNLKDAGWSLEALIEFFHIPLLGRHTALGDALITSSIFVNLITLAKNEGDQTLGDLLNRQQSVTFFKNMYQQMDWQPLNNN